MRSCQKKKIWDLVRKKNKKVRSRSIEINSCLKNCNKNKSNLTKKNYFAALGFLKTRITESPLRNILLMYLSLVTGFAFFWPFPTRGFSVHISLTSSRTMLQCRSKALTRPKSRELTDHFFCDRRSDQDHLVKKWSKIRSSSRSRISQNSDQR